MKTIILLCALLIELTPVLHSSTPLRPLRKQAQLRAGENRVQNNQEWRAGTYRSLTPGKSTRADVLRMLGDPKRRDIPADQKPAEPNPEVWYVYDSGAEFPGELTVVIEKRTGVILRIDLNPNDLSKEDAVKHFGPDYILTRYDFDECLGGEESAPLYESATGSLLVVEYRHRGIAVSVNDEGKVNTISYVSKPIGSQQSRCRPSKQPKALPM